MQKVIFYLMGDNSPHSCYLITRNIVKTQVLNSDLTFAQGDTDENESNVLNVGNVSPDFESIEALYLCLLLRELRQSKVYRHTAVRNWTRNFQTPRQVVIKLKLVNNLPSIIDDAWGIRMNRCAMERLHLDTVMSWLSTLGGACSALGDFSSHFAHRAGSISSKQLEIASRIGDPVVVSQCRLYASISLIQQGKYKMAASIIRHEYEWAHSLPEHLFSARLVNMCLGIWTKLRYEYNLQKWKDSSALLRAVMSRKVDDKISCNSAH